MPKKIKSNLAYLRFINGRLSQRSVSEATGIGQKTLSSLETGASKGIEFNTLLKLCTFFRCTPSDLFVIEEAVEDLPVSEESRKKAKDLVARGLQAAIESPPLDSDSIWAEFDAVRNRMQDSAEGVEGGRDMSERLSKGA